ncbi:hypothetical protein M409DRAFT_24091 [Zasmidium cellare ATCC 36951]|uniref:Xylanolytic transcriptional activator regulatory domain-containing protein n=1 Tax=Zasmidium cellare ATCC 36951 TaxID=1080233 RepID=A0A6A6CF07_ZASCE|nr:uncharacterized protein M409DRAFT_24091 [Zasmidium cellare ATCC 36951]KAF2165804.1 hypothetical protein M409DRAFT_24091 [Zasmidium cellare ATCC 36951]
MPPPVMETFDTDLFTQFLNGTDLDIPSAHSPTEDKFSPSSSRPSTGKHERFTLFPHYENKQHPFGNYWTCIGGLSEVVGVLPSKSQADLLVEKYFNAVDPLYPVIFRPQFTADYELFWAKSLDERCESDAAFIALMFIVFACGTQHVDNVPPDERVQMSQFYVSASHQSLCLFSYLNRCSLSTMQTMVMITYYLISNNHISDAWTFSGMTQRQAYGLGLNRNPDVVRPDDSFLQRQQCCRLWQATMFQDTSLSLYCEMPPGTTFHDIDPTCLRCHELIPGLSQHDSPETSSPLTDLSTNSVDDESRVNDVNFLRAMWEYASWCQNKICIPRALHRGLCTDAAHKAQLISEFRSMYSNWSPPFNSYSESRFGGQDTRLLRQIISVSSNFYWVLMCLYMDKDEAAGYESDIYGALEAAHEGLSAFFVLVRYVPSQADTWCAHHTRAYEHATTVANILATHGLNRDARLLLAKSDLERYLDILLRARGASDYEPIRKKRIAEIEALRASIKDL